MVEKELTSERARDTRLRLLSAAASSFRQRGYAATSTRQLAAELGMQSASLYHYMKTKDDLLFAICEESLKRISAAVSGAISDSDPPLEALRKAIQTHVVTALRDRDMHATMLVEMRALDPRRRALISEERATYADLLGALVDAAQTAGDLREDYPSSHMTLALLNLLNWSIFWFRFDGELTDAELGAMLGSIFIEGALARPDPSAG